VSFAVTLQVERLDKGLPLPAYAYPGDAGLDLCAAQDCVIEPLDRVVIPTGLRVAVPDGHAGFVQPRSGLAARVGLSLVNTPGLIDSQYRGEIALIAINLDSETPIEIRRGDRVAQLVIVPVPTVHIEERDALEETSRASRGFGSSGVSSTGSAPTTTTSAAPGDAPTPPAHGDAHGDAPTPAAPGDAHGAAPTLPTSAAPGDTPTPPVHGAT
jgi:dUTP pyrophosphatase